jgi:asparagine synthase (glutamine-hydrolysing)
MCGITGILSKEAPIDSEVLEKFTLSLRHRGPDGCRIYVDKNIGLGQTRLAILDLNPQGQCPLLYTAPDSSRYWITFNGEIYNFLELRRELQSIGHTFSTDTDTEVILAAYAQWGEECLFKFNGMWAFAIWNEKEKELFIARDRFGVKPLYYSIQNSTFAFSSELKSFTALQNFSLNLNENIIPTLVQKYRYDGRTDETAMKNVYALLPGTTLKINSSLETTIKKWWNTSDHLPEIPVSYTEQVSHFKELFLDAVRLRMRSDVPVASCLSGGIDSSSVVCAMSHLMNSEAEKNLERCSKEYRSSFISSFPGTKLDESQFAQIILQHVQGNGIINTFNEEEALQNIVQSVWTIDEPGGGYVIPVWLLYKSLKENKFKVSIDGHGGDELLCGYTWYLDLQLSQINTTLYKDFHTDLLPTILRNYDRCSMAHGIEVRMPFMDYRLVTYCFALDAAAKIHNGYTKRILRDAMVDIVPDAIRLRRQKIGFNVPMIEWFNGKFSSLIDTVTASHFWMNTPYFNGAVLRENILQRCRDQSWAMDDWDLTYKISTLLNLTLWQILFIENKKPEL